MPRQDLLVDLVKAGVENNQPVFRRIVETLIAEERAMEHHVLARQLEEKLVGGTYFVRDNLSVKTVRDKLSDFAFEVTPHKVLNDLSLSQSHRAICERLIEEQLRRDYLRAHNLEPRHSVLLFGLSGNGKSSLTEALADALMVPLFVVKYDALIGSLLGETSSRLSKLFAHIRSRACVLFFDEFETLGSNRDDDTESGEMKRILSSLLFEIDQLPSHVVIVTATSTPENLDRALRRRFEVQIELPPPATEDIMNRLLALCNLTDKKLSSKQLSAATKQLEGRSFAEIESFCQNVQRRFVLSLQSSSMAAVFAECLSELF